ncbi:MAG: type IV pilus assembly protein PilM [bacterium]|nr:type IV pilus assembly protein PilM [bacterium]
MFGKKDISVGLDIGTDAVKMVQLLKKKNEVELISFGSATFPPEAIADGVIVDPNSIVEAIRKVIAESNTKIKQVKVGLSGRSVIVKKIKMPLMSEEELRDSIHWEAEQHIPFSIDEVVLDFQIISDEKNEKLKQMGVLLVAAKKDKIKSYMDILSQLSLEPVLVDLDSFAIANSFEASSEIKDDEVLCLLNLGGELTNLNIMKKTSPYFVREISVGGNHFTRAIQKEFNVDFNKAEEMKINIMKSGLQIFSKKAAYIDEGMQFIRGAGELEGSRTDFKEAEKKEEIPVGKSEEERMKMVIGSVMEQLVNEVRRSFDYFHGMGEEKEIKKIILSGGTSRMIGLVDYFSDIFKISVEVANPFANIKIDETKFDIVKLRELSPVMGVSIGLALR